MRGRETIGAVVAVAREKRITANAASLAFYAFDVFVALVVLIYAAFTQFGTGNVLAGTLHLLTGIGAEEFRRLFEQVGSNAAVGWTMSAIGLRAYVGISESVDLYGIVGGVLLVLTWLYVVGLSIVLGAVLNALLAGRIEADREWYLFGRR